MSSPPSARARRDASAHVDAGAGRIAFGVSIRPRARLKFLHPRARPRTDRSIDRRFVRTNGRMIRADDARALAACPSYRRSVQPSRFRTPPPCTRTCRRRHRACALCTRKHGSHVFLFSGKKSARNVFLQLEQYRACVRETGFPGNAHVRASTRSNAVSSHVKASSDASNTESSTAMTPTSQTPRKGAGNGAHTTRRGGASSPFVSSTSVTRRCFDIAPARRGMHERRRPTRG